MLQPSRRRSSDRMHDGVHDKRKSPGWNRSSPASRHPITARCEKYLQRAFALQNSSIVVLLEPEERDEKNRPRTLSASVLTSTVYYTLANRGVALEMPTPLSVKGEVYALEKS